MFSDVIKSTLEKEIAGQSRAVNSVVRGVTRAVSDLVPREGPLCAYMFMGPTGTGKTHLIRTLARTLHGDERRLVMAECTHFAQGDPWGAFVGQIAPLFAMPRMDHNKWAVMDTPPLSILLIEYLERGRPEVAKALAAALETGRVSLPEGRQGSLRNCLVFITTSVCSRELLDESPGIGFKGATGEDEEAEIEEKLFNSCQSEATEHFGPDLLGRLDDLILFHRLQEDHLSEILDRLVLGMNHCLTPRRFQCRLMPAARTFLLDRGRRDLRFGARDLVRAHRRFVEFPVSDLMISGRIPVGGLVVVDRRSDDEHLHFTIKKNGAESLTPGGDAALREVSVTWDEEPARV